MANGGGVSLAPSPRRTVATGAHDQLTCGGRFIIEMEYEALKDLIAPNFGAVVMTREGTRLFHLQAADMGGLPGRAPAAGKVVCDIPAVRLLPGTYVLGGLGCRSGVEQLDLIEIAGEFEVIDADVYGTGRLPDPRNGVMLPEATWSLSGSGTPQERR